jgi:putative molybdopterin biosynthesis protein
VAAALTLARTLDCSVEDLFGEPGPAGPDDRPRWAWAPHRAPVRYWEAEVGGRRLLYPVESLSIDQEPHDGATVSGRAPEAAGRGRAPATLVLACCDPAAGLLAAEYARNSGGRLLVFLRGGGEALDLLKRGVVHVAGLHRATTTRPDRNMETVRARLGSGFQMVRAAHWQEGVAVSPDTRTRSPRAVVRTARRWALREPGSAARECLETLGGKRRLPGRTVRSHAAVAEAVRGGWADAGVCVRWAAEEAGLHFLPVRTELLDFCFPAGLARDPRVRALLQLLRSRSYRQLIGELPGYDTRETGALLET